jgi:hypothetical protein
MKERNTMNTLPVLFQRDVLQIIGTCRWTRTAGYRN